MTKQIDTSELSHSIEPGMHYTACYAPLSHGSIFSGIGGFDLAAEWVGWQNRFHCEWNEFGQRILKHYWPNAESYGDITKTDFTIWRRRIDVLTGGFPCQPYSIAGKRLGKEDERHLWPEMLRAILEIAPRYIVGENVAGLLSWNRGLVFDEVQTDLEAAGYEIQPVVLPACSVNAPHKRERVWFVAHARNDGQYGAENGQGHFKGNDGNATGANAVEQFAGCGCETARTINANTDHTRLQRSEDNGGFGKCRKERNQQFTGLFRTTWNKFPIEPPICSGNDGISPELDGITFPKWRNESIKAFGNAIVPQVAYQIFKAIQLHDASLSGA